MADQQRRTGEGPGPAHRHADRRPDALAPSPGGCTPRDACGVHDTRHVHDASCGHPALDHVDQVDEEVESRRPRPHGGRCDDRGPMQP